jgi:hypothetical protein
LLWKKQQKAALVFAFITLIILAIALLNVHLQ